MYLPVLPASIPARSIAQYIPVYTSTQYLFSDNGNDSPDDPKKGLENWSSLIGIITAVVGNILIALALNVQRYAHTQLHKERARVRERAKQALKNAQNGGSQSGYGAVDEPGNGSSARSDDEAEDAQDTDPLAQSFQSAGSGWSENSDEDAPKPVSTYLQSPYWWLGQILITVGEMGNFLAYGFAPASIVSPLGVVALVSNCIIAPIIFKERFRSRDFWGVVIAVFGAVTVVLSANTQETKLDPHAVLKAITTTEFEVYMGVTCGLIILLMWLSPKYGNRTILIDLSLVGLFGGYTALSTKGVSSMLSSTLLGAFTTPVTYVLLVILLGTAIMQVRYLNNALQRFDSTQVIPIQFVSFTLCVIIGSAVLYRDFERTTGEQAIKFIGGCLLTFFGVFLITSGRPPADDDEDLLSDEEGVEETIGLAEQDLHEPESPGQHRHRGSDAKSSRRSSRVSFMDALNKPLAVLAEHGAPTSRTPTTTLKTPLQHSGEASESAPLLQTQSREPPASQPVHPGVQHALSYESAVSISSATPMNSEPPTHPGTPSAHNPPAIHIPDGSSVASRPTTSSASRPHLQHFTGPLFSPSPFHSTVSGLVPATLLKDGSPTARRPSSRRHSRPSLRSSLYVPQNGLAANSRGEERAEDLGTMSAIERSRTAEESQIYGDNGNSYGVRSRARSLTHTMGELFGLRGKREAEAARGENGGHCGRNTNISTETL
ncbi:NIPA-like protein 2 [Cytospora mali]|uniref:NIPA-like protein 2 n=1 Tax=Cytospora mali TaxID=578113 RepID=A0A194VL80_CYTMA|nr:NIPA-like protein 2 [Valsa mali]